LGFDIDLETVKKAVDETDKHLRETHGASSKKHEIGLFFFSMCKFLGLNVDMETAKKKDKEFFELWMNETKLMPNAKEILDYFKEKGYKIVLMTNAGIYSANYIIDRFDLRKYFDLVVISEEVGEEKSTGLAFKITLDKLNLKPEEVIVVGDSIEEDVAGARLVGIKTVRFDFDRAESCDEGEEADHLIHDLAELKKII